MIRAGYAINTIREDASTFAIWGNNQGRTFTLNVDPTNFPAEFGAPGSVLFRNPVLPARSGADHAELSRWPSPPATASPISTRT